jgi:hypothetical protein
LPPNIKSNDMEVASAIIGVAAVGVQLSTALYTFAIAISSAEQDVTSIAGDIALTSNVLQSVGFFLKDKDTAAIASKNALQDAEGILKRCRSTFGEVQEIIDKTSKVRNGDRAVSKRAQFLWPLKGTRMELLQRCLEGLKTSLLLLLKVLQFARQQASGYVVFLYKQTSELTFPR